ncbi:unnamed protein product [Ostreobium quekettii]|uniref:FAS1 domain-containing protein n=1 Tax=Ostreobium quekettii TaxID=121088 RepID=A0A8S1IVP3_9CHLO|nr:unnamed protein product [Ostreobium quekettii]|eukprot:evm.model.scf_730EXC.2 EVM.evm.TU.scf_730EXC.2   scf_730EXC:26137-36972(+)
MGPASGAAGWRCGRSGGGSAALVLRLLYGLVLVLQIAGQQEGKERGNAEECRCSDVQPPGTLTCVQQRDYGKCRAIWMMVAPLEVGLPEGYCQSTCGRCECEGAPVWEDSMPVVEGAGDCECSDVPVPDSTLSCEQQRELGKCFAVWMRRVDGLKYGYCQKTCGLCPCDESGAQSETSSVLASPGVTISTSPAEEPATESQTATGNVTEVDEGTMAVSEIEGGDSAIEGENAEGSKAVGEVEEGVVNVTSRESGKGGSPTTDGDAEAAEAMPDEDEGMANVTSPDSAKGGAPTKDEDAKAAETEDSVEVVDNKKKVNAMAGATLPTSTDPDVEKPKGKKRKNGGMPRFPIFPGKSDDVIVLDAEPTDGNATVAAPDAEADAESETKADKKKKKNNKAVKRKKNHDHSTGSDEEVANTPSTKGGSTSASVDNSVPSSKRGNATAAETDTGPEDGMADRKHRHKAARSAASAVQTPEPDAASQPKGGKMDIYPSDMSVDGSEVNGTAIASPTPEELQQLEDMLVNIENITDDPVAIKALAKGIASGKAAAMRSLLGEFSWAALSDQLLSGGPSTEEHTGEASADGGDGATSAWATLPQGVSEDGVQVVAAAGPPQFGAIAAPSDPVPDPPIEDTTTCKEMEALLNSPIGQSQFKYINQLLTKSGLLNDLKSPTLSVTLFVPLDDAFESDLPEGITLDAILNDNSTEMVNLIRKVVLYNWVPGVYKTTDFQEGQVLRTTYGTTVQTSAEDTSNTLQMHFNSGRDAWEVESAGGKFSARIDIPDVNMCWSVIHVVNRILWPEGVLKSAGFLQGPEDGSTCETIVDLLEGPASGGQLTYLKTLIDRAGLLGELRNPDFKATIFAPTDEAIDNMPEPYCVQKLLADNTSRAINEIQKLLLFHVVPRPLLLADMEDGQSVGTFASLAPGLAASGEADITFMVPKNKKKKTKILAAQSKAKIITPDIKACGVVVHFIDSPLIPTFADNILELLTCTEEERKEFARTEAAASPEDYEYDYGFSDTTEDRRTDNEVRNPPEPVVRAASGSTEAPSDPPAEVDAPPPEASSEDPIGGTNADAVAGETSLVNFNVVG